MATKAEVVDEPDWGALRSRFPIFKDKIFINSCSYGALADSVDAAFQDYLRDCHENGSDWMNWIARYERFRASVADFLGAAPEEIAVTTSASAGINAVASAVDFSGERNRVVITDFEFPTNAQIWFAQEMRGAEVVLVRPRDGMIHADDVAAAIDERTTMVAVTHVCYRNGAKLDVSAIARKAREMGALSLIDGFQVLGTIDTDVAALGADFVVGGTLKYMLGCAGVAFLYARKAIIEESHPTFTGWFAQEDIDAMDHRRHDPAHSARRFESGTPPVPNIYAGQAGIDILAEVGLAAIETRIAEITGHIKDSADALELTIVTPRQSHGPMIAIAAKDAEAVVGHMAEAGIVISWRDGNIRISPHFYNNLDDVDRLFAVLESHRDLMA